MLWLSQFLFHDHDNVYNGYYFSSQNLHLANSTKTANNNLYMSVMCYKVIIPTQHYIN